MFNLTPSSWISTLADGNRRHNNYICGYDGFNTKDYKRLLSYHAISQVGYMILGIGTAVPLA